MFGIVHISLTIACYSILNLEFSKPITNEVRMRLSLLLVLACLFSDQLIAETIIPYPSPTPVTSPVPTSSYSYPAPGGCGAPISHVTAWRCVCRLNIPLAGGGSTSIPLEMNGQTTIFSATELSGACSGRVLANPCNPVAINGANAVGVYSCISVTTTDTGVTIH